MYITKIELTNIRSITNLSWSIENWSAPGWHVIIGDNGSGKSTLLRAISLALVGPIQALALRQDWNKWLKYGTEEGVISLDLAVDEKVDKFAKRGKTPQKGKGVSVSLALTRNNHLVKLDSRDPKKETKGPERHVWSQNAGWFSAGYGPFRRFTGDDPDYRSLFHSNPKLAPHLSVFGENVALTECIKWLQDLQFKKLENRPEGDLLDKIVHFVNQEGFLPHQTFLEEVSSDDVIFVDGNNQHVSIKELSDGYRSILSMTFELIRQLLIAYQPEQIFSSGEPYILAPGVVLIDEIDAHLHPTWQVKIGDWLCKYFPYIQFIVTTHSPLICHSASKGTIYRLSRPGTELTNKMVTGIERDRLIYGNVLDAYSTEAFGENVVRSAKSQELLQELAHLNQKERSEGLTESDQQRQNALRAILSTSPHYTL